jgi:hypothetical protein
LWQLFVHEIEEADSASFIEFAKRKIELKAADFPEALDINKE